MLSTSLKGSGKNVKKRAKSAQRTNEENKRDCGESNTTQIRTDKKPSISVGTLKMENLTLESSSSKLENATPSPSNKKDRNLSKKRKTKTPVPRCSWTISYRNSMDWETLLSYRSNVKEDMSIFDIVVPNTDSLKNAHRENYKNRLLDKLLDFSGIIDNHICQKVEQEKVVVGGDSMNQPRKSDYDHERDYAMGIIHNFNVGVKLLKLGHYAGKEKIEEAADKKLPYAMYTYAILIFGEVMQYHYSKNSDIAKFKQPTKEKQKKAVRYMIELKRRFFPLPNFVLGIIQLYNIGFLAKIIEQESIQCCPWNEYLYAVLIAGVYTEGSKMSDVSINIFNSASRCKRGLNFLPTSECLKFVPLKYMNVLQDDGGKYLKWMVQSTKYELANDSMSKNLSLAKSLLTELSSQGFVDAEYFYASGLLTNAFRDGQAFESQNVNEALDLLKRAVERGHQEAKLLYGTIPFREKFDVIEKEKRGIMGWGCFDCLRTYVMHGKSKDFRKEAAVLVASEYLKRSSCYATYNEEKAKTILEENGCSDELKELERYLQAREDQNNALPDVLNALEEVNNKFKTNGGVYAERLSPVLHLLVDALQGLKLTVRKSQKLALVLQLVHLECAGMDTSTMEQQFLILIQLYEVLQTQVGSQAHCSVQKNVLTLLHRLFKTCVSLQMDRIDSKPAEVDEICSL